MLRTPTGPFNAGKPALRTKTRMAEVIQLGKAEAKTPEPGGFVLTESARDMLRSLQMVREEVGAMTLIAAAPGTGKTKALWHFKNTMMPKALLITATAGEDDTPWGLACQLMQMLNIGKPNNRDMRGSRLQIAEAIGPDTLLLIDEAQNLIHQNARGADNWDALLWLRDLSEAGFFSLAFCGDLSLIEGANRAPGLWRRWKRRVIIKAVSRGDVEALCEGSGQADAPVVDALYQVAKRGGGLADVDTALGHARLLARGASPGRAHILAAIEDLKLDGRGVK